MQHMRHMFVHSWPYKCSAMKIPFFSTKISQSTVSSYTYNGSEVTGVPNNCGYTEYHGQPDQKPCSHPGNTHKCLTYCANIETQHVKLSRYVLFFLKTKLLPFNSTHSIRDLVVIFISKRPFVPNRIIIITIIIRKHYRFALL